MSCVSIEKRCVPKDWQRLRNHTNGRYSNVLNTISRGFAALFIPRSTDFIPTLFQLIRPLPCVQTWCWFLHTWHLPWNLGKSMRWWWDPFEKKSGSSGSWGLGSGKTTWTDTAACKLQWHCANCTLVSNKNNGLSRFESWYFQALLTLESLLSKTDVGLARRQPLQNSSATTVPFWPPNSVPTWWHWRNVLHKRYKSDQCHTFSLLSHDFLAQLLIGCSQTPLWRLSTNSLSSNIHQITRTASVLSKNTMVALWIDDLP